MGPRFVQRARRVFEVEFWVESFRVLSCRTTAHSPENRARGLEGPIKLPEAPEDTSVRSWVLSVECVAVIQVDHHRQGGLFLV